MEYLGAKIDIDISDFVAKMKKAEREAERTAKTADEEFRKVYRSFKENVANIGSVPLDRSITELSKNLGDLNAQYARLGTGGGREAYKALQSVTDMEREASKEAERQAKVTAESSEQIVQSLNSQSDATIKLMENLQSLSVVADSLGSSSNGGLREMGEDIKALLKDAEDGKLDVGAVSEQISIMTENAKRFSAQNLGKEDKERVRQLSAELSVVSKRIKDMMKTPKDNGLVSITRAFKSLARYVSSFLPPVFRRAFTVISRSINGSGIVLAISAIVVAIKKLYDWNEKLIGQKWTAFKDKASIIFGFASAEEYASRKVKEYTKSVDENTEALFKNARAQRSAFSTLAKAKASGNKEDLEKYMNETFGEREWSWFGEGKAQKLKLNGADNQAALDRYLNLSATEIEKMSEKEIEETEQAVRDALTKSEAIGRLTEAEKRLNKARENYNNVTRNAELGMADGNSILFAQQDIENAQKVYNAEKLAYDKILETIKLREDIRKRLDNLKNKAYFERENKGARDESDRMQIDELGTPYWAELQTKIDESATALRRFSDERGYQIEQIEKEAQKRKLNSDAIDSEFKSLDNLKIEYDAMAQKLKYLKSLGVTSQTNKDMMAELRSQMRANRVEQENLHTQKLVTLLEREADLKKRCNELDAQKDFNIRTIEIEIEKTKEHIRLMESEKNISDKEKAAIEELNMKLEELYVTKDKLTHQNWLSEQEHELELINTRIEREKVELDTLRKRGLIDDDNYDVQSRNLDAKSLEARKDALEAEQARLKAKKEECELTYEEQQRYESIGEQIDYIGSQIENVLTKDITKMNDNLNATNKKAEKLRDTFGAIADAMYGMADAAGNNLGDNSFSNVANGLGKVGETMANMDWESMKNYQSKKSGGQGGKVNYAAIAQAAEFVADQTTKIIASQRRIRESARQWKEELEDVAHQYALMQIEKIKYESSNSFGVDDPYEQMAVTAERYNEARKKTMESLQKIEAEGQMKIGQKKKIDWSKVVKDSLAGAAAGAAVGSMAGPYGAAIGAAAGLVTGFVTGIFASREMVDVMSSLRDQFGDIFDPETLEIKDEILASYDKLDDRTKKLVDNYKELKEQMDEAKKEYVEFATDIFGDIGKTLAEQLAEAFRNGDVYDAIGDFKDYVKKQMENLISQQLYQKLFGGIFDRITKNVEDSIERGSIDFIGEMSALPAEVERLAGQYSYYLEQVRDAMGGNWDLFSQNEQSQDAMKGTIASMSEETAGKINGNFMGLKLTAMEINEGVSSIRGINEEANAILSRSYNVMQRIEANTAMLHEIAQDVGRMRLEGVRAL